MENEKSLDGSEIISLNCYSGGPVGRPTFLEKAKEEAEEEGEEEEVEEEENEALEEENDALSDENDALSDEEEEE